MQPGLTSLETLNRDGLGKDYGNKRTIGLRISAKKPSEMHLFETVAMETEKQLCIHYERLNFFSFYE